MATPRATRISCSLCLSNGLPVFFKISHYVNHLRLFHCHQPNFKVTCGIDGCVRTFTNIGTFKNHISLVHHDNFPALSDPSETDINDPSPQPSDHSEAEADDSRDIDVVSRMASISAANEIVPNLVSDHSALQRSHALFLLRLKEKHKLTQVAIQDIVQSVTDITQQGLSVLKSQVDVTLHKAGIPEVEGMQECFKSFNEPFTGLETPYLQLQYCKNHLDMIEPIRHLLGERNVWKGSGAKRRCITKEDNLFYIPVLKTLQCLLNDEFVLSELEGGHKSSSDIMSDYCDGSVFESHPLYSREKNALQIYFYFDELEICNPLGSKTKIHKLGTFYFTLGNLSPKYRSQLTSIYLVALVKSSFISTYGIDEVIRPFVNDVKKLEKGVEFTINGQPKVLFGTIAVISADNLGSLLLGGFKESCSAYRMCRHCLCTKDESTIKFTERSFEIRNKLTHKAHCALIESDSSGAQSKEWGINRDSILNELSYFHVCDGSLLPDVMHDILEGSLQYEVKLMLQVMVNKERYFSLDYLNMRLENFELGYMEAKNRPSPIAANKFNSSGNTLKQNASQMNLLAHILPLVIGYYVPEDDEYWLLFLQMMEITDLLLSPSTSNDHAAYVATLVNEHHQEFRRLYPDKSIIPKMHFLSHMGRLLSQYGPLVRHWTMRFEAKHSYFKRLAQSLGNYINIPYSLSMRHQQNFAYLTASKDIGYNTLEIGKGSLAPTSEIGERGSSISTLFKAAWVKCNGIQYKLNAGVIIDVKHDLPIIGQIEAIYVVDNNKILLKVNQYWTNYEPHYRAYTLRTEVQKSTRLLLTMELFVPIVVHIRKTKTLKHHFILPYELCTL